MSEGRCWEESQQKSVYTLALGGDDDDPGLKLSNMHGLNLYSSPFFHAYALCVQARTAVTWGMWWSLQLFRL